MIGAVKEQIVTAYTRLFEKTASPAELQRMLELRADLRAEDRHAIVSQFANGLTSMAAMNAAAAGAGAGARSGGGGGSKPEDDVSSTIRNLLKF